MMIQLNKQRRNDETEVFIIIIRSELASILALDCILKDAAQHRGSQQLDMMAKVLRGRGLESQVLFDCHSGMPRLHCFRRC